jgi:hypothetical protein
VSLLSVLSNGELPLAVRVNDLDHLPHYVRTQADAEAGFDPLSMRTARREGSRGDQECLLPGAHGYRDGHHRLQWLSKSTLMRAMAGILPPTSGSIEVWGRASTLLALGSGSTTTFPGGKTSSWAGWLLGGGACSLGSVVCRTAGPAGNFRAGVEGLVREVGVKDNGIATTMLQG